MGVIKMAHISDKSNPYDLLQKKFGPHQSYPLTKEFLLLVCLIIKGVCKSVILTLV